MNSGSQSGCDEGVYDPLTCQQLCQQNGWDQSYYIAGSCDCVNGLPASYERDSDDIDDDGDTTETIRWRYVVVVNDCRIVDSTCQEKHQLMRCWSDDEHQ